MKKRRILSLILLTLIILLLFFSGCKEKIELTPEEQKTIEPPPYEEKKVELTPEELEKAKAIGLTQEEAKTAKSLDITLEEFKEVSTKAEETFKEGIPSYKEGFLEYHGSRGEIILDEETLKRLKMDYGIEDLKPDSKIIYVYFYRRKPSPSLGYLVEDGKVILIGENLHPIGF